MNAVRSQGQVKVTVSPCAQNYRALSGVSTDSLLRARETVGLTDCGSLLCIVSERQGDSSTLGNILSTLFIMKIIKLHGRSSDTLFFFFAVVVL